MDTIHATKTLASLAQPTRLEAFRLLIKAEPHGLPAGEIARKLGMPHNTLSGHVAILSSCRLVTSERRSRSIIYRANLAQLREIILSLLKDCCAGKPEICAPLIADLTPCCDPQDACHD
jgi:ArsR family transcriptional regulator, arsenate/arsenite/antimonite-responsive transcriptional repressor